MAREPITLFARIAAPVKVLQLLREFAATLEIDGADEEWRSAVITFGSERNNAEPPHERSLKFTHNPAYYAEPNWSSQMSGLRGYLSQFPDTDRKQRAIMLTTSFQFSLGTLFEPDFDPANDPRLAVLYEVTELLDGVLFTPSSLRDARGRILFGAGGEDNEDLEAVWPRVIGAVSLAGSSDPDATLTAIEDDSDVAPPNAARVARRALALTAVTARAILELEAASSEAHRIQRELLAWLKGIGIDEELEPDEWETLQRPLGRLDQRAQIDFTWRLEALVVLAWALGRFDIPGHDQLVKPERLWRSLGIYDLAVGRSLLANPKLRPQAEIHSLRSRLFALHWRLRNYNLNRKILDFSEFARSCWFGPLDISGLPLVKGDLAIKRKRIDRASPDDFAIAHSSARERHQAANWLCDGPERFSDASEAT